MAIDKQKAINLLQGSSGTDRRLRKPHDFCVLNRTLKEHGITVDELKGINAYGGHSLQGSSPLFQARRQAEESLVGITPKKLEDEDLLVQIIMVEPIEKIAGMSIETAISRASSRSSEEQTQRG